MLRILMVSRRYPPDFRSGSETVIANLYRQARDRNEVLLVAGFHRDRSQIPSDAVGVDLRGRGFGHAQFALWRAVLQAMRRFRPDVVLSNNIEAPTRGGRTVCIVHDLNFGAVHHGWQDWLRERIYLRQGRRVAAFVTVSRATRDRLAALGVDPTRVHPIHNGVDLIAFSPGATPPDDGVLELVYPSRFVPGKGQHVVLDAVARLGAEDKARVHLTLVGAAQDPVYVDQLRVAARGQPVGIETDVPNLAPYYRRADLVVFPTLLEEGFGFTAIEAMACGRPVAWSDQPAIREATGGIGLPVHQGDVIAWRDLIQRVVREPQLVADLGDRGRHFVQERYDWGAVWQQYEALLSRVAGGQGLT